MATYANPNANIADDKARKAASAVSDTAADLAEKAGRRMDETMDSAQAAMRNLSEQSREAGERMQAVAGNMKTAIDKSVRDQPMATLAVAAAFGFVLGALWKS